ncbi:short-chain dehydrogenase [Colletotrichum higginsianum]|nr:short-chain dehydrogenase [Colletotrichum higginsianum]
MSFPSKTTLITGATSGIGLALADRLVANGTYVIAVGRRTDRLDALVSAHGPEKVAAEPFDVTDLEALPAWVDKITSTYPSLDTIILNAGIQRSVDFTSPSSISLSSVSSELATNYLAPPRPRPHPRCPNYCATKSALHSLAWSLRAQLAAHGPSAHIRVVEVVPPAVRTELHSQQPDLVAAGQADFGMPLDEFTEETWAALLEGNEDEIIVGPAKNFAHVEMDRKKMFDKITESFNNGNKS